MRRETQIATPKICNHRCQKQKRFSHFEWVPLAINYSHSVSCKLHCIFFRFSRAVFCGKLFNLRNEGENGRRMKKQQEEFCDWRTLLLTNPPFTEKSDVSPWEKLKNYAFKGLRQNTIIIVTHRYALVVSRVDPQGLWVKSKRNFLIFPREIRHGNISEVCAAFQRLLSLICKVFANIISTEGDFESINNFLL